MSVRPKNILLCTGGLLIGGAVYLLFREGSYLSHLFDGIPLLSLVRDIFNGTAGTHISFYLPDFLWAFSLCCGIQAIYLPKGMGIYVAGMAAFACGLIWEILQRTAVVSGTGDYWDILMYFLGSVLAILVNKRRENHEKT